MSLLLRFIRLQFETNFNFVQTIVYILMYFKLDIVRLKNVNTELLCV